MSHITLVTLDSLKGQALCSLNANLGFSSSISLFVRLDVFFHSTFAERAISELPLASSSKRVLVPIFSYENEISFTCKLNSFSYE